MRVNGSPVLGCSLPNDSVPLAGFCFRFPRVSVFNAISKVPSGNRRVQILKRASLVMGQSAFLPAPTHASDFFSASLNVVVSSRIKECQMKAACVPATEKSSGTVVIRMLVATVAALVMLCLFSSTMAFGQCNTLGGTVYVWQGTGTGNWDDPSWNQSGFPNSATSSACITN